MKTFLNKFNDYFFGVHFAMYHAAIFAALTVFAATSLLASFSAHAQSAIEVPRSGWRNSEGAAAGFQQQVNYPAASVNAIGHDLSALIKGRVEKSKKSGPSTLIVNGIAMPMSTDADGKFERPYAFAAGSNSVEVRNADGKKSQRMQFYDAYASKPQARLRVVLSWDSDGTDLDLHLVSPDGRHVYFGNRVADNGGSLDVDVTTGYGPEIFANPTPPVGVYHIYVNYYGSGGEDQDLTIAQVAIITQEGTLAEKKQIVQIPMRKPGELTLIKSFSYP